MEEQKEQTLARRRAFCTAANQSLLLLSYMNICRKHFSRFLHNLKAIYEYKYMYIEYAAIGNPVCSSISRVFSDDVPYDSVNINETSRKMLIVCFVVSYRKFLVTASNNFVQWDFVRTSGKKKNLYAFNKYFIYVFNKYFNNNIFRKTSTRGMAYM